MTQDCLTDGQSVQVAYPLTHSRKRVYFYLTRQGVVIDVSVTDSMIDAPDFVDALKRAMAEQLHVFGENSFAPAPADYRHWERLNPPFVFRYRHGLYDVSGEIIDTDTGFATVTVYDSEYLRENPDKLTQVFQYIDLAWHRRIVEEVENAVLGKVEAIVSAEVERGVALGVSSAVEKNIKTLIDAQRERKLIEDERRKLDIRLQALENAERNIIQHEQARQAKQAQYEQERIEHSGVKTSRGYVYLIQREGTDVYKIGKSGDPRKRLSGLQTSVPERLILLHTISTDDMHRLEPEVHQRYAAQHISGEWYRLTSEQVTEIMAVSEVTYQQ